MVQIDPVKFRSDATVQSMFEALGTPTLLSTLAAGHLVDVVELEELERYATLTAVRWNEAASAGLPDPAPVFAGWLWTLFTSSEPHGYVDVDGEPGIDTGNGVVVVTDDLLRHWEWIMVLTSDRDAAEAFLAAVPETVRAAAYDHVEATTAARFNDIVADVEIEGWR